MKPLGMSVFTNIGGQHYREVLEVVLGISMEERFVDPLSDRTIDLLVMDFYL
jgi:hypothetical protein